MTFTIKFSGDRSRPMICAYTCPEHGEFDAEVARDEKGEAPDTIPCPALGQCSPDALGICKSCELMVELYCQECPARRCGHPATWTPSAVACRVRRIEAVKGKWEPPARKTYLDTRELAEGQDIDDFRAKRAAIWEEKRQAEVMAVKKGFG